MILMKLAFVLQIVQQISFANATAGMTSSKIFHRLVFFFLLFTTVCMLNCNLVKSARDNQPRFLRSPSLELFSTIIRLIRLHSRKHPLILLWMLSTIKGCFRLLRDALDYYGMLSTIKGCFRLSRMLSTEYGKKIASSSSSNSSSRLSS